jgi:hypothetical protein
MENEIKKGSRISFLGDMANKASDGTVTFVGDGYFSALLDNGSKVTLMPVGLLATPRWRVLAA